MKFYIFFVVILCLQADFVDNLLDILEKARSEDQVANANAVPKQTLMDMVSFEEVGNGFCRDANGKELKQLTRQYSTPEDDVFGKNGPCALLCANYEECTGIAVGRYKVKATTVWFKKWEYSCHAYGNFKHTPPIWKLQGGSVNEPAQGGGSGIGEDAKCRKIIRHPIRGPVKVGSCPSGQFVKTMANGDESCVPNGSIDWNTASCNILRPSPNGSRFPAGCKGAVWGTGNPNYAYCKWSWFDRCCEWNVLGVNGGVKGEDDDACIQKIDCQVWPLRNFWNDVAPKVAPEMGPCSWGQWSDGSLNNNYCDGREDDGKLSFVHPWFQKCCRANQYSAIQSDYGKNLVLFCQNNEVWPRKEGVTYYEY